MSAFRGYYHQQYLAKNPNGYCGIGGCGVPFNLAALQLGEKASPTVHRGFSQDIGWLATNQTETLRVLAERYALVSALTSTGILPSTPV